MTDFIRDRNPTLETLRKARKFAAAKYRSLRNTFEYGYCHESFAATEAIKETGEKFGLGFGPEGFCWEGGRDGITYLNMGDTYDSTIIFDSRSERFSVGSYGDFVEYLERQGIEID